MIYVYCDEIMIHLIFYWLILSYHSLPLIFQVDFGPESNVAIQRAAHVVKGAAANLMCQDLRESATKLEAAAKSSMEKQILIESYKTLSAAIANFRIVAAKGM